MIRTPAPLILSTLTTLATVATPAVAGNEEVVGTAYTVLLRGHGPSVAPAAAPVQPRSPWPGLAPAVRPRATTPSAGMPLRPMRLLDARSGRELATASHDPRIDGYLFRLPMGLPAGLSAACLLLKSPNGSSLPVRDERPGDDGYAFAHPAWTAEVSRLGELRELQQEHAGLVAQLDKDRLELDTLLTQQGAVQRATDCPLGDAQPEPARPLGALDPARATAVSGAVCALAWEKAFARISVDPGRLFGEAGLGTDWTGRAAQQSVADSLGLPKLPFAEGEGRQVMDAAVKGKAYLEHAEGVRAMVRVHGQCKSDVQKAAAGQLMQWQALAEAARHAPQIAQQQCQQRVARIGQLRSAQQHGPVYRAELERRIATLQADAPASNASQRLDDLPCKDS